MKKIQLVLVGLGIVLVFFPLIAPIVLSLIYLAQEGQFMLDYLMPAEIYPFALFGTLLLIVIAAKTKIKFRELLWTFILGILMLVGLQVFALVTGVANGDTPFEGFYANMLLSMLVLFILCQIALGVFGIILFRILRNRNNLPPVTS